MHALSRACRFTYFACRIVGIDSDPVRCRPIQLSRSAPPFQVKPTADPWLDAFGCTLVALSRLSLCLLRDISTARHVFPRGELLAQVFELCHGGGVRIVAKQKMMWRTRRLDGLEDGVCGANRISRLFAGERAIDSVARSPLQRSRRFAACFRWPSARLNRCGSHSARRASP